MLNNNIGIYGIFNHSSSKIYVGSSIKLRLRYSRHKYELKSQRHGNEYLQRSYNKHGAKSFSFFVIEYCGNRELRGREKFWIDYFESCERFSGYNICDNTEFNMPTEETRKKISQTLKRKGIRPPINKWGIGNGPMKGRHHTKETKEKIRQLNIGKIYTADRLSWSPKK